MRPRDQGKLGQLCPAARLSLGGGLVPNAKPRGRERFETICGDRETARFARAVRSGVQAPERMFDVGDLAANVLEDSEILRPFERFGADVCRMLITHRQLLAPLPLGFGRRFFAFDCTPNAFEAIAFALECQTDSSFIHSSPPYPPLSASNRPTRPGRSSPGYHPDTMTASARESKGMPGTTEQPSDAILTVPNFITLVRLGLIPVFIWVALGRDRLSVAFWIGLVIGGSDFVDGLAARRLGQVSKLGTAIDPLFDRVAVAASAVVLIGAHLVPWPALAIVLGRDLALVLASPVLAAKGIPRPPVSTLGKWGSFGTMYSFGIFLLSGVDEGARHAFRALAWWTYVPAVTFSYAAAAGYAREARRALRAQRPAG